MAMASNRFVAKFNSTGMADLNQFSGDDAFAGNNTNAIVIELPISLVAGAATKFGTWSVTYLRLDEDESTGERFVENFGGRFGRISGSVSSRLRGPRSTGKATRRSIPRSFRPR